jgi:hypothetical protein
MILQYFEWHFIEFDPNEQVREVRRVKVQLTKVFHHPGFTDQKTIREARPEFNPIAIPRDEVPEARNRMAPGPVLARIVVALADEFEDAKVADVVLAAANGQTISSWIHSHSCESGQLDRPHGVAAIGQASWEALGSL